MDLGPHAAFILASYAIFFIVLTVLVLWIFWKGTRLRNKLSELEAQGVTRRTKKSAT